MNSLIKIFTTRMPVELNEAIKIGARKLGISANALILQILWDWAEKQKEVRP